MDDQPTTEEQSKARKSKATLAREVLANDIKWLMGNRQGRRIAWRQLDRAGVYRTSFGGNADTTNFNEGQRNMGLMLIADIHAHAPEAYTQMLAESRAKE